MSREECAQRRGNCFRRTVAAMKPEAQSRPRQDSQQHKDALGRTTPIRKETWPPRHPRTTVSAARPPDTGKAIPNDHQEPTPAHAGGHACSAVWSFKARPGGVSVNHPSSHTGNEPPASWTARIRTTCRSKPRRTYRALPMRRGAGLADPALPVQRYSRGAKPRAAGIARRAFPRRQAQRGVPQARRQLDEESGVPPAYCNAVV